MRTRFDRPPGFPSRLQHLADLAGGLTRLAALTGLSRRTVSDWARGAHEPHSSQYVRVSESCGVDLHWLRTGEGHPPRKLDPPGVVLQGAPAVSASELAPPVDLAGTIPVVAQGYATVESLSAPWADDLGVGSGAISVRSTDRTAEPTIRVGEPVLAARVRDAREELPFAPGAAWVVETDSGIVFRRAEISGNTATLTSLDGTTRERVPVDALRVLGRAVWTGVRL